jgi:TonB-linked SusC/RagA family outer membrane protein
LTITGVLESQSFQNQGFSSNANNLLFPNLSYDNLTLAGTISSSATYSKSGLLSYIGRVNYSYKDKYLLTASLRRDGSSKFQENNKFSTFPSAAVAWKISEEPFLQNLTLFEQLKLRLSYGVTGSQAINPYGTLSSYYSDAGTSFNNAALAPNLLIGNPGNSILKWETTESFDVGLDVSILKGKVTLTVDYYKKNTSDLLMPLPVPAYIGGGNIISNVGEIENSGLEFSIFSTPVRSANFSWTSNLVTSFLKNKVVSLGEQKIYYYRSNIGAGLSTQPEFALVPGYGVGSYWGLKYLGTWKSNESDAAKLFGNKPGDSKYEDVNGDKKINSSDFQIIGNGMPKTSIGWNNTFQYKGLSLNVFIQALMGFDKLNYTYGASIAQSADARQATLSDIKERFITGTNEDSDIPAFSSSSVNYLQSTRFLENGNFVRIKNLNLSYDLPTDLFKKCSLKLFVGGINLFTITKYKGIDPESSSSTSGTDLRQGVDYGSYPNSKKLFAGLVLKF